MYFGRYGGTPTAFRVLKADGSTMFLDCDTILLTQKFDADKKANPAPDQPSGNPNDWRGSDLEKWLNGTGYYDNTSVFTSGEKSAILQTTLAASDPYYYVYGWSYRDYAANDYVYLLSAKEADTLYADNAAREKSGSNNGWWLRSTHVNLNPTMAGIVDSDGYIFYADVDDTYPGVSPALNMNLLSVLFTSASIENGTSSVDKSSSFAATSTSNGKTWNLTLAGGTGFTAARVGNDKVKNGSMVTVTVNNIGIADTAVAYTQISAMLVDENGTVTAYRK